MEDGFVIERARLLTLAPHSDCLSAPRRGAHASEVGPIEWGYVEVDAGGRVASLGAGDWRGDAARVRIDAHGRVVLPGWVDCHTHACFAGSRLDEWERKQHGATYLEILASGGGIMSTVRAVRAASRDELAHTLADRLRGMAALGAVAVEVKTGYGLDLETELRMIDAIYAAAARAGVRVRPTFLGGHAIDPDAPQLADEMIDHGLEELARRHPGMCVDAFCEVGSWSLDQCVRYFERAGQLGLPIRVHADQFHELGMTQEAIRLGALSVDHLEATSPDTLMALAESATMGVALPATAFSLGTPPMNARAFIDAGGAFALASNFNPGSAPSPSLAFSISLAVRFLGLSIHEAITAATWNAACLLGIADEAGCIAVGRHAWLQMIPHTDERALGVEFAGAPPDLVLGPGGASGADGHLVRTVARALANRL